jgi:hypothetical protein
MDIDDITRFIRGLERVEVTEADGDTFFVAGDLPADQRLPFATIVTSERHERASDLDRPAVFRLNIGVSRETYATHFGAPPSGPITADPVDTAHDYTALDVLMPHPIYASLNWVCVLNPSDATFEAIRPLLVEAHATALGRHERREARERSS